jgi:hypothetical protein
MPGTTGPKPASCVEGTVPTVRSPLAKLVRVCDRGLMPTDLHWADVAASLAPDAVAAALDALPPASGRNLAQCFGAFQGGRAVANPSQEAVYAAIAAWCRRTQAG